MLDVNGIKVGLVAATYGTNGFPLPADEPWSVPIINVGKIEAMAHRAREQGADIVLVGLHWGDEYVHTPSDYQVDIAQQLSRDKDISLIYGEHAHVVQPITRVNGKWVIYGLGNTVAAQSHRRRGRVRRAVGAGDVLRRSRRALHGLASRVHPDDDHPLRRGASGARAGRPPGAA